jgi:hypothetical protein
MAEPLSVEPRDEPSALAPSVSRHDGAGATGDGAKHVVAVRGSHGLCDVRVNHRDHLQEPESGTGADRTSGAIDSVR